MRENQDHEYPVFVSSKDSFFDVLEVLKAHIEVAFRILDELADSDNKASGDLTKLFEKIGIDPNNLEKVQYYENPFINRNWEYHNIYIRNLKTDFKIQMTHLEIKHLEEYLKINPNDQEKRNRLESLKKEFEKVIVNSNYVD